MGQRSRGLKNLWYALMQGYIKVTGRNGVTYTVSFIPQSDVVQCIKRTTDGNELIARVEATFENFSKIMQEVA